MDSAKQFVLKFNEVVLNPVIGLLFAIALVVFLWGVVEFLLQSDSEEAREKGKSHMLWGVIGMFIMFSVFAIIRLIAGTIGADVPSTI